jgi:hypothetical protein
LNNFIANNTLRFELENLKKKVNTDVSGKWVQVEELDKFVELIIEECYKVVVKNPHVSPSLAGRNMKEHFGVKE